MTKKLLYADYEGTPVVSIKDSGGCGWFWHETEGKWKRCHLHMVLRSALRSKAAWEEAFGPQPLPQSLIDEVEIDESPLQPAVVRRCADEIEEEWEKETLGSARERPLPPQETDLNQ
jgi:hypothetical protein